uniref:Protein KTI12 homolog n=1 Tax=Clastoptera arizonana TaxID=38151 RepID=A0A1B6C747_9HEMI
MMTLIVSGTSQYVPRLRISLSDIQINLGYRYELYCATKGCKTTQLTIECCSTKEQSWEWNCKRTEEDRYSQETFDALIMRYEAPDSRNRWDSPLIVLQSEDTCPFDDIFSALFDRKPPPPNQSTQSAPLTATNFLFELDKITQDIVASILSAKKNGLEGNDVKVPGFDGCVISRISPNLTPAQLARHRRQFLAYTRLNPPSAKHHSLQDIAQLFVQFLNTTLIGGN